MRSARWRTALVGLGSNLGDRSARMGRAVRLLRKTGGVRVGRLSPLYRTSPVGKRNQPWFYNAVVMINTRLSAAALLQVLKRAERSIGRLARPMGGPREIDLDLLVLGGETGRGPVKLPHPRMHKRKFVLIPASDIAGGMEVPGTGATIGGLRASLKSRDRVARVGRPGQSRFRMLAGGRA